MAQDVTESFPGPESARNRRSLHPEAGIGRLTVGYTDGSPRSEESGLVSFLARGSLKCGGYRPSALPSPHHVFEALMNAFTGSITRENSHGCGAATAARIAALTASPALIKWRQFLWLVRES